MSAETLVRIIFVFYAALFGIVIGSFLNVVIYRTPAGKTIAKGHSMCMSCGHTLAAKDLVPLFSWLFLKGKCRYCGAPIASRYAKIESLTGLVFLLTALLHTDTAFVLLLDGTGVFVYMFIYYVLFIIACTAVISSMMIWYDTSKSFLRLSLIPVVTGFIAVFVLSLMSSGGLSFFEISKRLMVWAGSVIVITLVATIAGMAVRKSFSMEEIGLDILFAGIFSFSYYLWFAKWYIAVPVIAVSYGLVRALSSGKAKRYSGIFGAALVIIFMLIVYFINK